uniref:Geranylgeranyl transferase type-2 subunit alpha n=1 Tax=Tetranychus urticae TaxID=32264 RepID=T1KVM9_TETUR
MHGRVKVKAPAEIQAERAREERALAAKFTADLDKAWSKRSNQCFDEEALKLTGRILLQNADYQTIWNFRREIILHWKDHGLPKKVPEPVKLDNCDDQKQDLVISGDAIGDNNQNNDGVSGASILEMEKVYMEELKFTSSCLIKHPKSYGTWYHRRYIILLMQNPPFKEEIQACDHFLDLDERNFHCWDYRRFICNCGKIDPQNELQFTQRKIAQNFSNFSSFYYRSSLLTMAHQEKILNINDVWNSEYETVSNAIFVDPNDQSPWFYHKWLLAVDQLINYQHSKPDSFIHKIVFDKSNGRMIYQFHKPLRRPPFIESSFTTDDDQNVTLTNIEWKKIEPLSSYIWYHQIGNYSIKQVNFNFEGKDFAINLNNLDSESNLKISIVSEMPRTNTSNPESKLDENKLRNLNLLLELEPDNKWINLTLALIKGGPDETAFNKLIAVDNLRCNYYNDQKSKQIWESHVKDNQLNPRLTLNDRHLTCLYFTNNLTHLRYLDLSNNDFLKISKSFNTLILLETLIMDKNKISMVDKDFEMLSLKKLSIKNNCIKNFNLIEPVKNCPLLQILDVTGNNIDQKETSILPSSLEIVI